MAINRDAPFGFKPFRQKGGGAIRSGGVIHRILGTYGTKIYAGDLVLKATDGYINISTAGAANNIGSFAGCSYTDITGRPQFSAFWPAPGAVLAGTEVFCTVYDDPQMEFVVQTATGVAFTQLMVGANVNMISTHPGVDVYGESRQEADISAPGTAAAQLRIMGLAPYVDNSLGEHAKIIVRINQHLDAVTTGI